MKVSIDPVTRIEGHAKIAVFLSERGKVENVFFQATELRGYEKLLVGLPIEIVPRVASTICGICRGIHFAAALKAADRVFGVEPSETVEKIREILVLSHIIEDHTITLFALGLPDYLSPRDKSVFGVAKKLGARARDVIRSRSFALKILEVVGGKSMHPVAAVPGGWSKKIDEDERRKIENYSRELVELGKVLVDVVENSSKDFDNVELEVNFVGTRKEGVLNFYDGEQFVVNSSGRVVEKFREKEYERVIGERSVEWSYSKVTYLKKAGWRGFVEDEHLYLVGPIARLNSAEIDTPLAKEAAEMLFSNEYPVRNVMYNHWARAVEVLYAAEKLVEISQDKDLTRGDVRGEIGRVVGEGVGIVEAPRGLLIHHYSTDSKGIVREANIIVATTQNNAAINVTLKKVAEKFSKRKFDKRVVEEFEKVVRAFDPCMACATHAVGRFPIEVEVWKGGKLVGRWRN